MPSTRKKLVHYAILLIICFSVFQYFKTMTFAITANTAQGRIDDLHKSWQCHRNQETDREQCNWYYSPVFSFQDHKGQRHTIRSSISSSENSHYNIGERVTIKYEKQNPGHSKINSFNGLWFKAFFFSLWCLPVALVYLFLYKKNKPDSDIHPAWQLNLVKSSLLLPVLVYVSSQFNWG